MPPTDRELTPGEAKARFGVLVAERYAQASEPINLATLAHDLRESSAR